MYTATPCACSISASARPIWWVMRSCTPKRRVRTRTSRVSLLMPMTGQFADADDLLVGDVADIGLAEERQRVVLTQRVERDWPFDDLGEFAAGVAVALRRERRHELGVALITIGRIEQRLDVTPWRIGGGGGVEGPNPGGQHLADIALEAMPVGRIDGAG